VAAFYERELKSAGMKIQKTSVQGDNRTIISVTGTDEASQRTVSVTASTSDKGTAANVVYTTRK
jgi:phage-related protein